METEKDKYDKVLDLLKRSKPDLNTSSEIEREVIRRISKVTRPAYSQGDLIDFLFGWIYIRWVRRSLIAASLFLVLMFVWQQSIILKQVNFLSSQIVVTGGEAGISPERQVEKFLLKYKNSGKGFSLHNNTIPEEQMNQLLESVNELKVQYKDLIDIINENPELKKYIEDKLNEKNNPKTKL